MNCTRPACKLPADEGGLCFAHKSAFLIETVADVMRAKKILSASTGGVTINLHPAALADEIHVGPPPAKEEEAEEDDSEPAELRTVLGGG